LDELRDERSVLNRYIEPLEAVLELLPELAALDDEALAALRLDTIALVLDTPGETLVELLREELAEHLGARFELASRRTDADTVACLIAYPHEQAGPVHDLLEHEQVRHVALPERFERLSLHGALAAMKRRLGELPGALAAELDALRGLVEAHIDHWAEARAALLGELERIEARAKAGLTSRAFVLVGWLPRSELTVLRRRLEDEVGARLTVGELRYEGCDQAPVLMHNARLARPFETLVRFFELPRPGTVDPTALLALFLPLMFGVMVGDVVYGALLLGLSLWLRRRFAARSAVVADMSRIVAAGSVWAIVFGFLFGEALGNFARRYLGMEPLWFYRGSPDAIEPLFLFVLALGGAHVVLGLLLGIWQSSRLGERRELVHRAGTLAAIAGAFGLAGVALEVLPGGSLTPAIAAVVVGLVLLIAQGGGVGAIIGPVELAGAVGNVLSYLRLGAVGLASVYLAIVANEFAVAAPLAIGLVVAALLHALNLALAGFTTSSSSASSTRGAGARSSRSEPRCTSSSPSTRRRTAPSRPPPEKGEKDMLETGLIALGAGLAIGLAGIGAGYAQGRIGSAAIGAVAEKPELLGRAILLVAIPETIVILGFAVAAMVILIL
jgi:V/A-type H+-transporting ATPase subunit I